MELGLAFVTGSHAGRVLPLGNHAVVGTDPFANVPLRDPGVSSRHAQLYEAGGGYQLLDLRSTGGTFVNGMRVPPSKAVSLPPGSVIRFGEGGPLALFDDTTTLTLRPLILSRDDTQESWPLEGPVSLGRSRGCEIRLDPERDAVASSRHLSVLPAFGKVIITDLGSANGTFLVGGIRVRQAALPVGGRVLLGGHGGPWFRVAEPDPVATAPSPPSGAHAAVQSGSGVIDPDSPPPIPPCFAILVTSGDARARIQVACKPEVHYGSFAGLCDFEVNCFPRELEDEADAQARGESIGPQHGSFVLTEDGVDLLEDGSRTKLNGSALGAGERARLGPVFEVSIGLDVVALRGRVFSHPRLAATAPRIGMEGKHPVECVVMERKGDGGEDRESQLYLLLVRQASIGSSDEAAIHLPCPGVAPLHASIYVQEETLWITQVGETPVAVDGVPLSPGTTLPLAIGSQVYVGATKLVIIEA